MGSWDESCDLSGLPIKAGDRTVAFAVCKTPICDPLQKENVSVCYPVTFAMRGKYNDYGGVDRVEKTFTTEILAQEVLEADDLDLSDPDYLLSLLYERQLSLGRDGVKGVPALFLVREDIYEYLLTDKYVEEWIYRDHADSYRDLLEKDAQRFLEYMDDVFDNPSEHPLIFPPDDEDNYPEKYVEALKNLAEHSQGYSFLEWTDFDGHNFYGKDRSINLFQSIFAHRRESDWGRTSTALRMYSKWLFDRYYEGGRSDDPEVQQFVQDAIDFQLLAHNMVVLALDWIPRERGLQYKDGQPYADWHTLCLEKAEEIDD